MFSSSKIGALEASRSIRKTIIGKRRSFSGALSFRTSSSKVNQYSSNAKALTHNYQIASSYGDVMKSQIDRLKSEGFYREFKTMTRKAGYFPTCRQGTSAYGASSSRTEAQLGIDRDVTIWCSNDYLGMGQNRNVINAMNNAATIHGAGSGGTRNIGGTHQFHVDLEIELSSWHRKERALVFANCFSANIALLQTMGRIFPDMVILSDADNHSSLIEGIRASKLKKLIFRHNDVMHLAQLLSDIPHSTPKMIVFESVYSMDGSVGPIESICNLAKEYNALTFIDEVHAVGLYGDEGEGWSGMVNVMDKIDIISGTLGKAIGVSGGYIAASDLIIDNVRSFAPGFIFSTSPPPAQCAAAIEAVRIIRDTAGILLRQQHQTRTMEVRHAMNDLNLPLIKSPSHILPLMVGDAFKCKKISDELLEEHGIYIQPINYPTVPKGTERLRITPSPVHSQLMITKLVTALDSLWTRHNLRRSDWYKSSL